MAAQQVQDEPIGDCGAVGNAPALHPGDPSGGELLVEFDEEPRLADAGLADDADRLAAAAFDLPQKIVQNHKLAMAVDESRRVIRARLAQPGAPVGNPEQPIGHDRLFLALQGERSDGFEPRKALSQSAGRLAHQDGSRLGYFLQSGGHIGRVADRRGIHSQVAADRAKDDGSGVDAHPHSHLRRGDLASAWLIAEYALDSDRSQQCTPDMVFLRDRRAEQRHEPVAGKLRRRAAVTMHLGKAFLKERADEVAHRLGPEALGHRGGADDVAEQHRDLLHFAGQIAPSVRGSGDAGPGTVSFGRNGILQPRPVERRPALAAEFVLGRVAGAA